MVSGAVPACIKGSLMGLAYSNYLIMLQREGDRKRERQIPVPGDVFHRRQFGCVSSVPVLCFTASVQDHPKQHEAQSRLVPGSVSMLQVQQTSEF